MNRRATQLKSFLEQHFLDDYDIPRIGHGRKAVLASYGIETAADVTPQAIDKVPGFGPVLTNELLSWRKRIEAQFRFDPSRGIDPADIAALDQRYGWKRLPLERALTSGPQDLHRLKAIATQAKATIQQELNQITDHLAQAETDAAVVGFNKQLIAICLALVLVFIVRIAGEHRVSTLQVQVPGGITTQQEPSKESQRPSASPSPPLVSPDASSEVPTGRPNDGHRKQPNSGGHGSVFGSPSSGQN